MVRLGHWRVLAFGGQILPAHVVIQEPRGRLGCSLVELVCAQRAAKFGNGRFFGDAFERLDFVRNLGVRFAFAVFQADGGHIEFTDLFGSEVEKSAAHAAHAAQPMPPMPPPML